MFSSLLHPGVITPFIVVLPDNRGRHWRWLTVKGEWVGFFQQLTRVGTDGILIGFTLADVGEKSLPNATLVPSGMQYMLARFPVVKISDDGYLAGVRRPDGKVRTLLAFVFHKVRSQLFV